MRARTNKHTHALLQAHTHVLHLVRLDEQLQGLKAERAYLEKHGDLPPPGALLTPPGAPSNAPV